MIRNFFKSGGLALATLGEYWIVCFDSEPWDVIIFHICSWCLGWRLLRLGAPSAERALDAKGGHVRLRCRKTLPADAEGADHSPHCSFPDNCGRFSKRLLIRCSGSPRCYVFPSHHHFGILSRLHIGSHHPPWKPRCEGGKIIGCTILNSRNLPCYEFKKFLPRDLYLRIKKRTTTPDTFLVVVVVQSVMVCRL